MLRSRVVRSLAHRAMPQLDSISRKLSSPKTIAAFETLKNSYAQVEYERDLYEKEPEPIDFDSYRSQLKTKEIVDAFEQAYKEIEYEDIDPSEYDNIDEGEMEKMLARFREHVTDSKQCIEDLKETIELMEATRTSADTTIEELELLYPEAMQEIDDEIANYDWEKDTSI